MNDLCDKAENIIRNNSRGDFTIPCGTLYPFQWNWDSAFCALGIYCYNKDRAINEIKMLFKGQWENGMIPHIIFHKENNTYYPGPEIWESMTHPSTSCITQPPVITSVIWYLITLGYNDKEQLNIFFENLFKYHKWYTTNRDPYNKGLISIFHPWESGRDNSPEWDHSLNNIQFDENLIIKRKDNLIIKDNNERPTDIDYNKYMQIVYKCKELNWDNIEIYKNGLFNVCDPGVQFIFIKACKDLLKISHYLEKDKEINSIIEDWIELYESGCNTLWNKNVKTYGMLDLKTNKLSKGISCGSLLYAYADVGNNNQKKYMLEHSKRILHYSNYKYPFPSFDPNDSNFDRKRYWRGPIWCIINLLLVLGFKKKEHFISNKIKENVIKLVENFGFFEYYDPVSGKGYGGNDFSWTAAVYLIFKNNLLV